MRQESTARLALGILLLSLASRAPVVSAAVSSQPRRSNGGPYTAAASCGACHDVIYKAWVDSPHARSATSPAYVEALKRVIEPAPDPKAAREACVWCHAPTTIVTKDLELKEGISREGITCDFCHTISDVDLEKVPPFELKPGPVKRGPFEYAGVRAHETARSPLHRASPLLCASCHEFKNAKGVLVLSNYSEWKEGPYPVRGVPCQDCHMAPVPGTVAKDVVPKGAPRIVNLHRLVGGSAISQLARGMNLKIESVTSSGGSADVVVVLTNAGAGHSVPGGLSTKSLVLAVGAETSDGKLDYRQERVYRRELLDEKGVVLDNVADLFLKAASLGSDTRIKPMESRRERFTVPVPTGARAIIARLEYRDASDPRNAAPVTSVITEIKEPLGSH
jgi:cytochrome c554/c'-like protein